MLSIKFPPKRNNQYSSPVSGIESEATNETTP